MTKDDDSSNTSTANHADEQQRYSSNGSASNIKEEDFSNSSPPLSSTDFTEQRERDGNYSTHSSPMPEMSLNRAPSTASSARSSPAHSMSSSQGGGGGGGSKGGGKTEHANNIPATADNTYGGANASHRDQSGRFSMSSPGASNACSNEQAAAAAAAAAAATFGMGALHPDQLLDRHDFSHGGSSIVSNGFIYIFSYNMHLVVCLLLGSNWLHRKLKLKCL